MSTRMTESPRRNILEMYLRTNKGGERHGRRWKMRCWVGLDDRAKRSGGRLAGGGSNGERRRRLARLPLLVDRLGLLGALARLGHVRPHLLHVLEHPVSQGKRVGSNGGRVRGGAWRRVVRWCACAVSSQSGRNGWWVSGGGWWCVCVHATMIRPLKGGVG